VAGPDDIDDVLLRTLGDELIRLGRRRLTTYRDACLENSAFKILWLLVESGPSTLKEIAEQLQLEQSTINRQVHAAIDRGLVERFPSEERTALLVRATPDGEEAYRHDAGLRATVMREALAELGVDAADRLVADLRRLNDAFDRAQANAGRPAVDSTP
jgi:DNA-binding MarR family transcriptional regulator